MNHEEISQLICTANLLTELCMMRALVLYLLTISAWCYVLYGNQSFDLQCKPNNWFLYEMYYWAEIQVIDSYVFCW